MISAMSTRKVVLITTGGTIAGAGTDAGDSAHYTAGTLGAEALLASLGGGMADLPEIERIELFALDSKDMTPAHWFRLAQAVDTVLSRDDCDGVVITHGTDTLEETAWWLHLVLPGGKPVVLTAAMRPATALSSDGPMNLYQALRVAAHPDACDRGVLVVVNDQIFAAADIAKTHTRHVDALKAPASGPIGEADTVRFHHARLPDSAGAFTVAALAPGDSLPRVDILYVAAGAEPDLLSSAPQRGCAGVVLALPGNGSLPETWIRTIETLPQSLRVVRCTRTGAGAVTSAVPGRCESAGALSPVKARISLILALHAGLPIEAGLPGAG